MPTSTARSVQSSSQSLSPRNRLRRVTAERWKVLGGPTCGESDTSRQRESTDDQTAEHRIAGPVTGILGTSDGESEQPDRRCESRKHSNSDRSSPCTCSL